MTAPTPPTPPADDGLTPLFAVSYAHPAAPSGFRPSKPVNSEILQFFADLSVDMSELAGRDPGNDPGFIDRKLAGGQVWTKELLTAFGTCKVFVALVSPNYVGSAWCGKEWFAFERRTQERLAKPQTRHETAILPVRWVPMDTAKMPSAIRKIQFFSPPDVEIADAYHDEGLLGLIRTSQDQAYRTTVWRLAQQVMAITRTWKVHSWIPDQHELRNAFDDSGSS